MILGIYLSNRIWGKTTLPYQVLKKSGQRLIRSRHDYVQLDQPLVGDALIRLVVVGPLVSQWRQPRCVPVLPRQ